MITYKTPVGNALSQLQQFYIYPKHVWASRTGNDGKDLKAYQVQGDLPTVAGGPYVISKYDAKGVHGVQAQSATSTGRQSHAAGGGAVVVHQPDLAGGRHGLRATWTSSTRCRSEPPTALKSQPGVAVQLGTTASCPASASTPTRPSPRTASC